MLDKEGWLPQAQALPVGKRRRQSHDCGPGTTMIVSHELDAYKSWCFRCNEAGYQRKVPTLADQVEVRRRTQEEVSMRKAVLPTPMTTDVDEWPQRAKLWLYKAGLDKSTIARLGIYYHKPSNRVVLPIIEGDTVTYWQARAFDPGHQPKYLNPSVDRSAVLPKFGSGPVLVLTEDYLSAVKVGMVTEAWSLLGTEVKKPVLAKLVVETRPIVVWLDPDPAGDKGRRALMNQLKMFGVPVSYITSDKDPKLLSKEDIAQWLKPYY